MTVLYYTVCPRITAHLILYDSMYCFTSQIMNEEKKGSFNLLCSSTISFFYNMQMFGGFHSLILKRPFWGITDRRRHAVRKRANAAAGEIPEWVYYYSNTGCLQSLPRSLLRLVSQCKTCCTIILAEIWWTTSRDNMALDYYLLKTSQ